MLAIDYNIEIGSLQFKPGNNSRLIELYSHASMQAPVNYCRMAFTVPADLSMAVGDAVKVELGYKDDTSLVFTGVAIGLDWQLDRVVVEAESLTRQLKSLRINAYHENVTAGEIVNSLAGETDLATGRVEPGLQFAFYAVGSNRPAWDHIVELSGHCGFDLYADENDELVFGSALPGVPELFQFGINILKFQLEQMQEAVSGVEVFGESPASFGAGADASAWFTKKEVKGASGGDPKLRVYAPAARTQEAAGQMANNLWAKLSPKKTGRLSTLGKAGLYLGATVLVSSMPTDSQNGTYKITGFTHRLHPVKGFLTEIQIEAI